MGVVKGQYELSAQEMAARLKKGDLQPYSLDLKTALPELFVQTDKMPSILVPICRQALDENMKENSGYYAEKKGSVFVLSYDRLQPKVARVKAEFAVNAMKDLLKKKLAQNEDEETADAGDGGKKAKVGGGNPALAKVLKEGLQENPALEELSVWAARLQQEIYHGGDNASLIPQEMEKLCKSVPTMFMPVWNSEAGVVAGSFCGPVKPAPAKAEGEAIRQYFAALGFAVHQLSKLFAAGSAALVFVPVQSKSLQDKEIKGFYETFLSELPEKLRKCILIEIRGLSKEQMTPLVKNTIIAFSAMVRGVLIDTGILAQPHFNREGIKPHACGFDAGEMSLPEDELMGLMKNYAQSYKGSPIKTFARNISTPALFSKARDCGFSYLSGQGVLPPEKSCRAAYKLSFEELIQKQ